MTTTTTTTNYTEFLTVPKDFNELFLKFKAAIRHLTHHESLQALLDDELSHDAIFFLWTSLINANFGDKNANWSFINKGRYGKLAGLLLDLLRHAADQVCAHEPGSHLKTRQQPKSNFLFYRLIYILRQFSLIQFNDPCLFQFAKNLFDKHLVKQLLDILNEEKFFRDHPYWKNNINMSIVVLEIILNFTENSENFDKSAWHRLGLSERLDEFAKNQALYFENFHLKLLVSIRENIQRKSLEECLSDLGKFEDLGLMLAENQSYIDFLFILKLVKRRIFTRTNEFIRSDCKTLFARILDYIFAIRDELDFHRIAPISFDYPSEGVDLNERRISVLVYLLQIISNLIQRSDELSFYFASEKSPLVRSLLAFLADERLVRRVWAAEKGFILLTLVNNIYLLANKWSDELKKEWKEDFQAVSVLIKCLNSLGGDHQYEDLIGQIHFILAVLVDDRDIESQSEIELVVTRLLNLLTQLGDWLERNRKLDKIQLECLDEDTGKLERQEVLAIGRVSAIEILDLLKRLAVNEKNKFTIFQRVQAIKTLIYKAGDLEKTRALRLLAQLAFNDNIAANVMYDNTLMANVRELCSFQQINKALKSAAECVVWLIEKKAPSLSLGNKHIVVSYEKASREVYLRVKKDLERFGYKIWTNQMDVGVMAMAKAIEGSFCVFICVSEKYRLSETCQMEAQWALRLQKPIVALIVQEGYEKVHGWLGQMIRDRRVINLAERSFQEGILELKSELESMGSGVEKVELSSIEIEMDSVDKKQVEKINLPTETMGGQKDNDDDELSSRPMAASWTSVEVKQWLRETNVHRDIASIYSDVDGQTLREIFLMEKRSPDLFYRMLLEETNNKVKTVDIAAFISKLNKLFAVEE